MLNKNDIGIVRITPGIKALINNNPERTEEVNKAFARYKNEDWGTLDSHDWQIVDCRRKHGNGALQGAYNLSFGEIFIITERDRSVTTILLPIER